MGDCIRIQMSHPGAEILSGHVIFRKRESEGTAEPKQHVNKSGTAEANAFVS